MAVAAIGAADGYAAWLAADEASRRRGRGAWLDLNGCRPDVKRDQMCDMKRKGSRHMGSNFIT